MFINGIQSGVWTNEGNLTNEGHETALTGDVLIKEVGPLRIWTYENEVTGPVLLHAGRSRTVKQFAETPPQTLHAPSILENISDGKSRKGLLQKEQKRWQICWTNRAVHGPLLRNTTRLQIWYGIGIWKTVNGMSRINSNSNANLLAQLQTRIKMDKLLQINFIQDLWIQKKYSRLA